MKRWRGLKTLIHEAVDATVELVREGHESTARGVMRATDQVPPLRGSVRVVETVRRVTTDGVLGTIKFVNRSVEVVSDAGIDASAQLATQAGLEVPEGRPIELSSRPANAAALLGDAALGLVNAAIGDHLHATTSGLDLSMQLRAGDRYLAPTREAFTAALPEATGKVVVLIHGLGTTEWSWCLEARRYHGDPTANFGSLLAADLGYTPLYVRYNTGRPIADNGERFARLLEDVLQAYPVPITELTILGHSMGGLVTSSACHYAEAHDLRWADALSRVFYLGSPHQGAPFARFGHLVTETFASVDLPATQIMARILEKRSAGIQDLSHGRITDDSWLAPHPLARETLPLPHAAHHFISATITRDPEHPLGQLMGDLLVQVPSASGPSTHEHLFPIETDVQTYGGVWHHQLQNHPAVYAQIKSICAGAPATPTTPPADQPA